MFNALKVNNQKLENIRNKQLLVEEMQDYNNGNRIKHQAVAICSAAAILPPSYMIADDFILTGNVFGGIGYALSGVYMLIIWPMLYLDCANYGDDEIKTLEDEISKGSEDLQKMKDRYCDIISLCDE